MDIYRDYFNRESLVKSLEKAPYTPGKLGELGIFETVPLTSTTLAIEEQATNAGKVLTAIPRGAPRQRTSLDKRNVHTFTTRSYGDQGDVMADEVLNARGTGTSGAPEVIEARRNGLVVKLRRTMDLTHESLRMACLITPSTTEFGSAPTAVAIVADNDATKIRKEIFTKLVKPIESALGGLTYNSIHCLCEDGYWEQLIDNAHIQKTYLNWVAAAELRGDTRQMVTFGGVTFERYRGTADVNITANRAIAFPTGVAGMFFQGFAPNDTVESVGQGALGQPYYLGSMELKDSQGVKGWEVSVQSHARMVCGIPAAIQTVKLS
jgi:hypothetical protein